jgi:hypothetical protein
VHRVEGTLGTLAAIGAVALMPGAVRSSSIGASERQPEFFRWCDLVHTGFQPSRCTMTLAMLSKGRVAMTPNQLTGAARNLAHGLGIPVYIRDGRIYQQGPGLAFLPPGNARPTVAGASSLEEERRDEAE